MVELKAKILIKTSQVGYGMKLAAQLKKMGLDAVVRSILKRLPDENYKVILMDYEDDSICNSRNNRSVYSKGI